MKLGRSVGSWKAKLASRLPTVYCTLSYGPLCCMLLGLLVVFSQLARGLAFLHADQMWLFQTLATLFHMGKKCRVMSQSPKLIALTSVQLSIPIGAC
jgi:hypothetical protein